MREGLSSTICKKCTAKQKPNRAQSSMEYLMTYGWAILVIAIIVSILFALGLFGGSIGGVSNSCIPQPGFTCTNPVYGPNGISFSIGQNSGQYYFNVRAFVASQSGSFNSAGLPQNLTGNMVSIGELAPGQTATVNFNNLGAAGAMSSNVPVGFPYSGYIWISYCITSTCANPNYAKIAAISAKESGASAFSSNQPQVANTVFSESNLLSGVTWGITYNSVTQNAIAPNSITFANPFNSLPLSYTVNPDPIVTASACYAPATPSGTATPGNTYTISFAQSPCSVPAEISYYLPVTFTNSQSSDTLTPFQQMFTFDSQSYQTYEASNLDNIEFFYSNGSVVYSWLESGNSNSAGLTTYWLKLNKVPAHSSITIYMGFAPTSTSLFNSQTTGEAPQLSSTYGQYDDGKNVFFYYQNFAGMQMPPSWIGNASVNNGLVVPWSSWETYDGYNASQFATALGGGYITDFYVNMPSNTTPTLSGVGYFANTTHAGSIHIPEPGVSSASQAEPTGNGAGMFLGNSGNGNNAGSTTAYPEHWDTDCGCGISTLSSPTDTGTFEFSMEPLNALLSINYVGTATNGWQASLGGNNDHQPWAYLGVVNIYQSFHNWGQQSTITLYWVGVRSALPNNIMPSQATGSIVTS